MNHNHDSTAAPTPCREHPGDWMDPTRRALTRHQCLSCPSLRGCAAAARQSRPSYGMWAGVWIDGDFTRKQHLLGRPGCGPAPRPTGPQPDPLPPRPPAPAVARGRRRRVGTLLTAPPAPAVAALITARASGHCEIMAPACTYQQSAIFTRRRSAGGALASPADALAACRNCIELIEHTDLPTAFDLGYLVDRRTTTSSAAVLWRQQRWVYLDTRGHLHPATGPDLVETA